MQCEAMLHNMRGNSRVACIDAQMHQDVFIIGVDIDAKTTENAFSPDSLLPPNQKRGRILGTYNFDLTHHPVFDLRLGILDWNWT